MNLPSSPSNGLRTGPLRFLTPLKSKDKILVEPYTVHLHQLVRKFAFFLIDPWRRRSFVVHLGRGGGGGSFIFALSSCYWERANFHNFFHSKIMTKKFSLTFFLGWRSLWRRILLYLLISIFRLPSTRNSSHFFINLYCDQLTDRGGSNISLELRLHRLFKFYEL